MATSHAPSLIPGRLEGKVSIITGAAVGIGRAAAFEFARHGARVVIADIDAAGGEKVAADIRDGGREATFIHTDVTSDAAVASLVERTVESHGRLDVLYNNAGLSTARDGDVTRIDLDEFDAVIRLNLMSVVYSCRHGIPALVEAGGGSVINTVSIASQMGLRGMDAFTAAKGGVASLTRSLAVEFAPHRVRVNAIAPTMIMTERVRQLMERQSAVDTRAGNLLGPGEPVEIAHLAVYLASDESRITTGQILAVDSGILVS